MRLGIRRAGSVGHLATLPIELNLIRLRHPIVFNLLSLIIFLTFFSQTKLT